MGISFKEVAENYDRIELDQIVIYAYHGSISEERKLGQRFEIRVVVYLDLTEAARDDSLNSTVNYHELFQAVLSVSTGTRFQLIEALGGHISDTIFERFEQARGVRIRICKLHPPIPEYYGNAIVEISRVRPGL